TIRSTWRGWSRCRKSLVELEPIHRIAAQHVLGAGADGAALVQHRMLEKQHRPDRWPYDHVVVDQARLTPLDTVVQIRADGALRAFAPVSTIGAKVGAVEVRREALAGAISIAAEALVVADQRAAVQRRRHPGASAREQVGGECGIVEHDALVVARAL